MKKKKLDPLNKEFLERFMNGNAFFKVDKLVTTCLKANLTNFPMKKC